MPTTAPRIHQLTRAEIDAKVLDYLGLEYTSDKAGCPIAEDPVPAGIGDLGETSFQVRADDVVELARICVMLGRIFATDADAADFATQLISISSRDGGPTIAARRYHLEA